MKDEYWQKQTLDKPLFPDIEWNKPEQKTRAGKLLIIGGNSLGFISVALGYEEALKIGAGQVRVLLPDALKKNIPTTILDTVFVASNPSGGMSKAAATDVKAALLWADHCLLIGDAGRNSETAMIYESILSSNVPLTITRDAVELLKSASQELLQRQNTTLVISFAQLQKLFQAVYYPKILSFSMQLSILVDTLHKFTITYPVSIVTFHQNKLIVSHSGDIITQDFDDPMRIWRGSVATKAATYQLWSPSKTLEAITASIVN